MAAVRTLLVVAQICRIAASTSMFHSQVLTSGGQGDAARAERYCADGSGRPRYLVAPTLRSSTAAPGRSYVSLSSAAPICSC